MTRRFRQRRWAGLFLAALACTAIAAPGKQVELLGQYIRSTQVVYPLVVGDWRATDEHRFDSAALGASIGYRAGNPDAGRSDIYVYPAGLLDAAALEQAARHEAAMVQAAAAQSKGSWSVDAMQPLQRLELQGAEDGDGQREPEVAWAAVMQVKSQGRDFHSVLMLGLRDMYFVKLRYSVPATGTATDTLATARALFEPLLQQLQVSNRGACYDPIPIVVAEAPLDPKMAGALASMEIGGKVAAVATPERVLTLAGTGVEPIVLQQAASAMAGRIGPGCVAPDLESTVPEGMRELRFEYPDPAAPAGTPAPAGAGIEISQG